MKSVRHNIIFRSISIALAVSMVVLDVSWAYPVEAKADTDTLAPQAMCSQAPMTELQAKLREACLDNADLLYAINHIGRFFFGNKKIGRPALSEKTRARKLKHLEEVLMYEGTLYGRIGSRYLKGLKVSNISFKDGIVTIPYNESGKDYFIYIAARDEAGIKNLPGYAWELQGEYAVKVLPKDFTETKPEGKVISGEPVQVKTDETAYAEGIPASVPAVFSLRVLAYSIMLVMAVLMPSLFSGVVQAANIHALSQETQVFDKGKDAEFEKLLKDITSRNILIRNMAAEGLISYGEKAVQPLINALGSDSSDTRQIAALTLGNIGGNAAGAITELKRISENDKSKKVRDAALKALERIESEKPLWQKPKPKTKEPKESPEPKLLPKGEAITEIPPMPEAEQPGQKEPIIKTPISKQPDLLKPVPEDYMPLVPAEKGDNSLPAIVAEKPFDFLNPDSAIIGKDKRAAEPERHEPANPEAAQPEIQAEAGKKDGLTALPIPPIFKSIEMQREEERDIRKFGGRAVEAMKDKDSPEAEIKKPVAAGPPGLEKQDVEYPTVVMRPEKDMDKEAAKPGAEYVGLWKSTIGFFFYYSAMYRVYAAVFIFSAGYFIWHKYVPADIKKMGVIKGSYKILLDFVKKHKTKTPIFIAAVLSPLIANAGTDDVPVLQSGPAWPYFALGAIAVIMSGILLYKYLPALIYASRIKIKRYINGKDSPVSVMDISDKELIKLTPYKLNQKHIFRIIRMFDLLWGHVKYPEGGTILEKYYYKKLMHKFFIAHAFGSNYGDISMVNGATDNTYKVLADNNISLPYEIDMLIKDSVFRNKAESLKRISESGLTEKQKEWMRRVYALFVIVDTFEMGADYLRKVEVRRHKKENARPLEDPSAAFAFARKDLGKFGVKVEDILEDSAISQITSGESKLYKRVKAVTDEATAVAELPITKGKATRICEVLRKENIIPSFTLNASKDPNDEKETDFAEGLRRYAEIFELSDIKYPHGFEDQCRSANEIKRIQNEPLFRADVRTLHLKIFRRPGLPSFGLNLASPETAEFLANPESPIYEIIKGMGSAIQSIHLSASVEHRSFGTKKKPYEFPLKIGWFRRSPVIERTELLRRFVDNINTMRANLAKMGIDKPFLVESLDYHATGAYEYVTEPSFIKEVLERTGSGFLVDCAHLLVGARNLHLDDPDYDFMEYVREIINKDTIGLVGEIHLTVPIYAKRRKETQDLHLPFYTRGREGEDTAKILKYVLGLRKKMGIASPLIINFESDDNETDIKNAVKDVSALADVLEELSAGSGIEGKRGLLLMPEGFRRAAPGGLNGVTGGTGFLGSQLVKALMSRNMPVGAIVRGSSIDLPKMPAGEEGLYTMDAEMTDLDALSALAEKSENIYHLAGISDHMRCNEDPVNAVMVNSWSTALLGALSVQHDRKLIFGSTFYVYALGGKQAGAVTSETDIVPANPKIRAWIDEVAENMWQKASSYVGGSAIDIEAYKFWLASKLKELDALVAEDGTLPKDCLYPITKLLGEKFVRKVPKGIVLRFANIYGPGQDKIYKMPTYYNTLKNLKPGEKLSVWPDVRNFMYVRDWLLAMENASYMKVEKNTNDIINIGADSDVDSMTIAGKIAGIMGIEGKVELEPNKKVRVPYALDTGRMKKYLLTGRLTSLDEGLGETVAYYEMRGPDRAGVVALPDGLRDWKKAKTNGFVGREYRDPVFAKLNIVPSFTVDTRKPLSSRPVPHPANLEIPNIKPDLPEELAKIGLSAQNKTFHVMMAGTADGTLELNMADPRTNDILKGAMLYDLIKKLGPVSYVSVHIGFGSETYKQTKDGLKASGTLLRTEAKNRIVKNIDLLKARLIQEGLGDKEILLENINFSPPNRLTADPDFINEVLAETKCGLLLDLGHAAASANFYDMTPMEYVGKLVNNGNLGRLKEIHISVSIFNGETGTYEHGGPNFGRPQPSFYEDNPGSDIVKILLAQILELRKKAGMGQSLIVNFETNDDFAEKDVLALAAFLNAWDEKGLMRKLKEARDNFKAYIRLLIGLWKEKKYTDAVREKGEQVKVEVNEFKSERGPVTKIATARLSQDEVIVVPVVQPTLQKTWGMLRDRAPMHFKYQLEGGPVQDIDDLAPDYANVRKDEWSIGDYLEAFEKEHPDLEILGFVGNSNVLANNYNVMYVDGKLHALEQEKADISRGEGMKRVYTAFIRWKSGPRNYSIEEIHVSPEERLFSADGKTDITDQVIFAMSGTGLVMDGKAYDMAAHFGQDSDLRHYLDFPFIPSLNSAFGINQFYINGEPKNMNLIIPAIQKKPVTLALQVSHGVGLTSAQIDELERNLLSEKRYTKAPDSDSVTYGQFYIDKDKGTIRIGLMKGVNPHNIICVDESGNSVVSNVIEGESNRRGVTFDEMQERLISQKITGAIVLDNGGDTMMNMNGEYKVPSFMSRNLHLSITIFARKKEKAKLAPPKPEVKSGGSVSELFQVVGEQVNNDRALAVNAGNKAITYLAHRDTLPKKADLLLVLGSPDINVAIGAAKLYVEDPSRFKYIMCSGKHSEVKRFMAKMKNLGVPEKAFLPPEIGSKFMGENLSKTAEKLKNDKRLHEINSVVVMQVPIYQVQAKAAFGPNFLKASGKIPAEKYYVYAPYIPKISYVQPVSEIKAELEKIISAINNLRNFSEKGWIDKVNIPEEVLTSEKAIKENIENLEPNAIKAAVIALAEKAKNEGKNFTIALETDWIPEAVDERGRVSVRNPIKGLMEEIESLPKYLESMGLDNVRLVHKKRNETLGEWMGSVTGSLTDKNDFSNTVFLVSNGTKSFVNAEVLGSIRPDMRPFMAGVDPSKLLEYDKSLIEKRFEVSGTQYQKFNA